MEFLSEIVTCYVQELAVMPLQDQSTDESSDLDSGSDSDSESDSNCLPGHVCTKSGRVQHASDDQKSIVRRTRNRNKVPHIEEVG